MSFQNVEEEICLISKDNLDYAVVLIILIAQCLNRGLFFIYIVYWGS